MKFDATNGHLHESEYVDRLVAEVRGSIESGVVPAAIYNDPEIHQRELEGIFSRTWVFVGHESEIPSPGDYRLRYVGNDPFILVRDEKGELHAFFDACRHRGTQVCRAEKGNTSHFRCPYHGWIYRNDGRLAGMPAMQVAFKGLKREDWGLIEVPKLESLHGLIFICLDSEAPTLDEYLGEMRWYMDLVFGFGDLTVMGEPQKWEMPVNWKLGAENFAGDDYHTVTLHKSMYDIGVIPVSPDVNMYGHHVWTRSPHAHHAVSFGLDNDPDSQLWWGVPSQEVEALDRSRLSPAQLDLARRCRTTVGTVFPNTSFIFVNQSVDPERKPPAPMLGVRQFRPKGPGTMELWSWMFSWNDASEEFRKASYECHMATFGSAGIFEQDDTEPWMTITRTAGTAFSRLSNFRLNYQMGSDGIGTASPIDDWPGPGKAFDTRYEEGAMRNLIRDWIRYMEPVR